MKHVFKVRTSENKDLHFIIWLSIKAETANRWSEVSAPRLVCLKCSASLFWILLNSLFVSSSVFCGWCGKIDVSYQLPRLDGGTLDQRNRWTCTALLTSSARRSKVLITICTRHASSTPPHGKPAAIKTAALESSPSPELGPEHQEIYILYGSFGEFCISSVLSFFRKIEISFSGKFLNRYKNAHRSETGVRFIFHLSGGSTKTRVREFSGFTHSFLTLFPGNTEQGPSELSAVWSFVLVLYTVWCSHSGQGWRGGGVKDSYEAALPEPHSLTPAAALCVSASCLMKCERCRWTRGQDHVQGRSSCWMQNSSSSSQYMIWSMKLGIKETSCSLICPLHRCLQLTSYFRLPPKGKRVQPPALTSSSSGV